jgi:hypothetical protein
MNCKELYCAIFSIEAVGSCVAVEAVKMPVIHTLVPDVT